MNMEQLKTRYPHLYNQAKEEGRQEQQSRQEMMNIAKAEGVTVAPGATAGQIAMAILDERKNSAKMKQINEIVAKVAKRYR